MLLYHGTKYYNFVVPAGPPRNGPTTWLVVKLIESGERLGNSRGCTSAARGCALALNEVAEQVDALGSGRCDVGIHAIPV